MTLSPPPLTPLVQKLLTRAELGDDDREAILTLICDLRKFAPSAYIVREGQVPQSCIFILSGFAFRQKLTVDGSRQILSIHIPGDFIDLQNLFLSVSDHNVQALTHCEVAILPIKALRELVLKRPAIGQAMWVDALIDGSIFREWIVNVGRRDARARVAHLLCEFWQRLSAINLSYEDGYELPMTQEQLADAVGLTPVHVNRVLRSMTHEGLISRQKRYLKIADWDKMVTVADFNNRYLHLEQAHQKREGG